MKLAGKIALITGGSRGIGRACCYALARAGARVCVNYKLERPSAELVVQRIEEAGGEAFALGADVAERGDADMLVDETVDRYGRLDVLVTNAGIWRGSPIEEMSDGEWREMLAVNLDGTFHAIRAAVPHMKQAGAGRIVTVSSTAGQRGESGHAHYAATKGAVISMIRAIAVEHARYGVRANAVLPGWIATDMTAGAQGNDKFNDAVIKRVPFRRWGEPEDFGGLAVYLASDASSFHTGDSFLIDGGYAIF